MPGRAGRAASGGCRLSDSAARLPADQVEALIAALPALDALVEQLAGPAGPQPARSAGR
jgi:hypothetical protein